MRPINQSDRQLPEQIRDHCWPTRNMCSYTTQMNLLNSDSSKHASLAVALAFIGKPKWIFCDEPTSSLDNKNTDIIINLIKEESLRCKASLILITHDTRVQSILNFSQVLKMGEML